MRSIGHWAARTLAFCVLASAASGGVAGCVAPGGMDPGSAELGQQAPDARASLEHWADLPVAKVPDQGPFACVAALPAGGFVRIVEPARESGQPERLERSADLRTWSSLGEFEGAGPGCFVKISFDGRRYVLVGYEVTGSGADGHQQPAVWTSPDLHTWTKSPTQTAWSWLQVDYIAANRSGFFIAGANKSGDSMWRSTDGVTWQPAQGVDGFVGGLAVVDGRFVAAGGALSDAGAAVWTSDDGATWAPQAVMGPQAPIVVLAQSPDGLVGISAATGWASDAPPSGLAGFVWTSTDGVAWRSTHVATFDNAMVAHLVAVRGGFVAMGVDLKGCAIWTSTDGLTWRRDEASQRLGGTPQMISDGQRAVIDLDGILLVRDSL